jgi:hypothetical protein
MNYGGFIIEPISLGGDRKAEGYHEQTEEELIEYAKGLGCTIEWGNDYILQLDLDTVDAQSRFWSNLEVLQNMGHLPVNGLKTSREESRSGTGEHAVVYLPEPKPALERILLQTLLGSDPRREALNYRRLAVTKPGLPDPCCLFRPLPQILETRRRLRAAADDAIITSHL